MKVLIPIIAIFLFASLDSIGQSSEEVSSGDRRNLEESKPSEKAKVRNNDWKERVFVGGNIGGSFGNNYSFFEISPFVGYRITPKFLGGLGFTYRYVSQKYSYRDPSTGLIREDNLTDHQYGIRPFLRYFILPQLFLHGEYEALNVTEFTGEIYNDSQGAPQFRVNEDRRWVNSALGGAGYFQSTGGRGGIFFMVLYNFIDCDEGYCPYPDRWIFRIGAGF